MIDFAAIRGRFPLLNERAYFASHSVGPSPVDLFRDLDAYRRSLTLGRRGLGDWLARWQETTALCESLLGAPPGSVALRDSATAAQAAIASAIEPRPGRDRIIISELDFPSARYMWKAQTRRGFVVDEVRAHDGIALDPEELAASVDDRTAIVAVSLAAWKTGALLDLRPVVRAAHAVGAIVIVDAFQAGGVVPLDVRAMRVDALVGGTVKWLSGGGGLAFLYVRPELSASLEPAYPGWFAHRSPIEFAEEFTPAPGAARFMQGGPSIEPLFTARAGLSLALEVGVDRIRARSLELTERVMQRADARGIRVRTPRTADARGAIVCFDVPRAEAVVAKLAELGIDIDCRPGVIRVGPHYCQREDECDRMVDAIAEHG